MNNVSLIGRIANDLELKTTQSGKSVLSFDLAVPTWQKDAPPDYITIVCWGKTAEFAHLYLGKGSQIGVTGSITTRKYTDKAGNSRKAVEVYASKIDFADSKRDQAPVDNTLTAPSIPSAFEEVLPLSDEELPF